MTCFLAYLDGQAVGGGAVGIYGDVSDLGFTCTLPQFRGKGVQKALLQSRLAYARDQGCTLATTTTDPNSQSERNVQRLGFQVAYTRTKFQKAMS